MTKKTKILGKLNYYNKVKQDKFELSDHAQKERGEERIGIDDIANAILTGKELEPYPEDPRRVVKNPNIPAVRFIGLFNRASFINETFTKKPLFHHSPRRSLFLSF